MKKRARILFVCVIVITILGNNLMNASAASKKFRTTKWKEASEIDTKQEIDVVKYSYTKGMKHKKKKRASFFLRYQIIQLTEEYAGIYPELNQWCIKHGEEHKKSSKKVFKRGTKWVKKDYKYMVVGYGTEHGIEIERADNSLFSILEYEDYYWGGAHPNFYCTSHNVDSKTGVELTVYDVLEDREAFVKLLKKKMKKKSKWYYGYDSMIKDVKKGKYDLTWIMNDKGIEVIFSPYEIASYGVGEIIVKISYSEAMGIFKEQYIL